ncbi:hypothetical protein CIPAW_13G054200 [Carya illinoinensis]|uniref:Uncharacterized protein n=1 Tax=Carya illinoinensis TaxID=32201 RepID=A0A8T1NPQ9_CARIL|nr:hypothetical protein CIPAW_13G054200 [Carya illinoinensis]
MVVGTTSWWVEEASGSSSTADVELMAAHRPPPIFLFSPSLFGPWWSGTNANNPSGIVGVELTAVHYAHWYTFYRLRGQPIDGLRGGWDLSQWLAWSTVIICWPSMVVGI